MTEPAFGVHSEVGQLRKVMVCAPGRAHQRLTPSNCDDLLFDDVMWVENAKRDHFDFLSKMRDRGIEVLEMHNLLADTVALPEARAWILDHPVQGCPLHRDPPRLANHTLEVRGRRKLPDDREADVGQQHERSVCRAPRPACFLMARLPPVHSAGVRVDGEQSGDDASADSVPIHGPARGVPAMHHQLLARRVHVGERRQHQVRRVTVDLQPRVVRIAQPHRAAAHAHRVLVNRWHSIRDGALNADTCGLDARATGTRRWIIRLLPRARTEREHQRCCPCDH